MREVMLAASFQGNGKLEVREIKKPVVKKEDEVLIKVEVASICGSDVQILNIPPGHPATEGVILGHEYVGIIEELGKAVKGLSVGERVVIEPNINCGHCIYCKAGLSNLCENMYVAGIFENGGFAEYSLISNKALHKVGKNTSPEVAVFAEPLSCVVNSLDKLNVKEGDNVVVLGAGPVGLLFIKALKAAGVSKLIVSERMQLRKDIASKCGAIVIDTREKDLEGFVKSETIIGADIVIDCVGSLLEEALRCCRKAGKVLLFGLNENAKNSIRQFDITHNEINLIGSYIAKHTFPRAIKILEDEIINVEDLITHRYSLEDFKKGLDVIKKGEAIKVLIRP